MTDRINGLTVILERDMREDAAQGLINAIGNLRGVLRVEANVRDVGSAVTEARLRQEIGRKLWDILYPEKAP